LASQRRFEGPVLEDLLDRVRTEVGPGAQIVAANRVRKGGLGGFFAKEFYEVVVDVAIDADVVIDIDEPTTINLPAATPVRAAATVPAAVKAGELGGGSRRVPASILDLAEAVNNNERHGGSTPVDAIDLVDDDEPQIVAPNAQRFAEILESLSHVTDAPPATRRERDDSSGNGRGIATEVRERMAEQAESARRTATAARVTSDPLDIEEDLEPIITPTALGIGMEAARSGAVARRVPRTEAVLDRPENLLARLGLPARLVPRGVSRGELRGALVQSLADLPATPAVPSANGVVIAVVGSGASAVLLARQLCDEYGLDHERIVLATQEPLGEGIPAWMQINDGSTAEERRRSWRRRPSPTIVAVSLPSGRDALPWARNILDCLEPTIAWSIVNAGWKPEDVRDWIERLGGVDTLALAHTDDTVSPAAILDLGIPVGRIEGRPATPIEWSELLMGRMQ
jgi:hypothetical protein